MIRRIRIASLFIIIVLTGVTTARAQSLRVMTWNIAHGDDINAQTDFIVTHDPDVLILQEVSPGQQDTYRSQLQTKTGETWYVKYKENCERDEITDVDAPEPVCAEPDNDGVAILSTLQFQDVPGEKLLWGRDRWTNARRALRVKVRVGDLDVQVFGTHLAAGTDFEAVRLRQVTALKDWMDDVAGPRILGGDINAIPGSPTITTLSEHYVDAWTALQSPDGTPSFTWSVDLGLSKRIDYWFSEAGSAAQPVSVVRPTFSGGVLSDHYPVVAVYTFGSTPGNTPFEGMAAAVPGRVQAENFDEGGEGVAYHDTTAGNSGGQYRPASDVDIEGTTDTGGGFNVGWMTATEWLEFTVNVATTGNYTLNARVASIGDGGRFHVEVDTGGDVTGSLTVPNTGGWQNWTTVSHGGIHLTAGPHVIRFMGDADGTAGVVGNLNWLEFVPESSQTELLADSFGSASLDQSKWSIAVMSGFQDTSVPVTQSNGHLNIGPLKQGVPDSHYNGILSNLSFDLTGASVRVRVVATANSATAGTTSFTLPSDSNNHYRMYAEEGLLWAERKIGGGKTKFSIPFDPVQHAWWRIRHDPATNEMVFETAPDSGGSPRPYVERRRMARELAITAMRIELKAGTWKPESTAPGTVVFDNVLAVRP